MGMKITVWGCRGSHPLPLTPDAIRSKIATAIRRVQISDLADSNTRERFLAQLPPWLFGTVGGNTSCVQVELTDREQIIFDAGSGIIPFGHRESKRPHPPNQYHIFFTHFHYDHVQGLPFFPQAYNPAIQVHFYSPDAAVREILSRQMHHPYFPVTMEDQMSNLHFHVLNPADRCLLYGATLRCRPLNHPGGAYAYRLDFEGRSVCYCTDVELTENDFSRSGSGLEFFHGLDAIILDTQYTLDEAVRKYNWGHSSFSLGVDFAIAMDIPRLFLFHHEPQYSDKKIFENLSAARAYARKCGARSLGVELALEGSQFEL